MMVSQFHFCFLIFAWEKNNQIQFKYAFYQILSELKHIGMREALVKFRLGVTNLRCHKQRYTAVANLNLNCQTLIPKIHIVPNSFINGRPFSIGISPRKNNFSYNNSAHSNFCRLREKSVFEHFQ